MNAARTWTVLKKDLKKAPRTGMVFLALLYPVMITGIVHLIFGSIFDPVPRVGIIDHGSSQYVADMAAGPVDVSMYNASDADAMWDEVAKGNLDLGIVFPARFDEAIRSGQPAVVEERVSTRANHQALFKLEGIALSTANKMAPNQQLVIEQVKLTDNVTRSWVERLLPLVILLAFFIAGTFLTGFSIVDEKMRGTMRAMLTGPTKVSEVMLAKSIMSFGIAAIASVLTLWLNGAIDVVTPLLLGALAIAAVMTIEFGIVIGFVAKDVNALSGMTKAMGPLVVVPAVMPFMWDGWPLIISQLNPLWYVIHPIVGIINDNKSLGEVGFELGIGIALCAAFLVAAKLIAERGITKLEIAG